MQRDQDQQSGRTEVTVEPKTASSPVPLAAKDDGGVGVDCGDDDGPSGVLVPPGERGRGAPSSSSSSSSLSFPIDGRRVSPMVHGLHGVGGARAPQRLDLSLCLSLFLCSGFCPFTVSFITGEP